MHTALLIHVVGAPLAHKPSRYREVLYTLPVFNPVLVDGLLNQLAVLVVLLTQTRPGNPFFRVPFNFS